MSLKSYLFMMIIIMPNTHDMYRDKYPRHVPTTCCYPRDLHTPVNDNQPAEKLYVNLCIRESTMGNVK